jgi:D-ribose pyranose/furanose isomerase RbsD
MAKQKAIVEETLPVEQVIVQQAPVVETEEAIEVGETIVEELEVEDAAIVEEVFETTPEAEQVVEEQVEEVIQQVVETKPAPAAPKASNEVGVVRILQKTPSGFRLLLETGEIVKVSKAQYTKGQSTIIL